MLEVVWLAKYNVYRYIGCIIEQSNWSGPFSLMFMSPNLESSDLGSRPGRGSRLEGLFTGLYLLLLQCSSGLQSCFSNLHYILYWTGGHLLEEINR